MSKTKTESTLKKEGKGVAAPATFVFGRKNYIMMLAGVALLVIGFILMYGPADGDIFEARRITVAPLVVLAGFVLEVFAIFAKSDK